jgi:uncharacterized membrane protein YdjX (TVP38/TMEM64 family)
MKKNPGVKITLLLIIASMIWIFFLFDLNSYLTLASLKDGLDGLKAFYGQHKILTMIIYFIIYLLISALSLPVAGITTLAGGALFGLFYGTILASFASTIGGTLAFLFSRYIFRDWVQNKFPSKLSIINKGIDKEGGFYLFTIRLVAIFPFFAVNLAMGLTSIRVITFYLVSQIGMLPVTMIMINAGTQLATIGSTGDILSLNIILSFALLGIFPITAKHSTEYIRSKRV